VSARVVNFCHTVVMVGLDHHNGLYYLNLLTGQSPGPPVPPMPYPTGLGFSPFTLHFVYVTSAGAQFGAFLKEDKKNPTVVANSLGPIVSRNHECRSNHLPPGGNLMLPFIQYSSSTKWFLGVSSVLATSGRVASTLGGAWGQNLNSGDPASTFLSNVMYAPGTVEVQPTSDDWALASFEFASTALVEIAVSIGFGKVMGRVKPMLGRIPLGRWAAWRTVEAEAKAAKHAAAVGVKRGLAGKATAAEAQAVADAAAAETKRLIEEGMPPDKAAQEAAKKATGDYLDKARPDMPPYQKRNAMKDAANEAAASHGIVRADESAHGTLVEGITGDGIVKPAAGGGTQAAQEWAEEKREEPAGGDQQ
jgi:hypothetical protein